MRNLFATFFWMAIISSQPGCKKPKVVRATAGKPVQSKPIEKAESISVSLPQVLLFNSCAVAFVSLDDGLRFDESESSYLHCSHFAALRVNRWTLVCRSHGFFTFIVYLV